MIAKIEVFDQKFAHFSRFEGSFLTILWDEKVEFWTFSKLFSRCLGNVFLIKMPTFGCIFPKLIYHLEIEKQFFTAGS